jgi:hypothetical protein
VLVSTRKGGKTTLLRSNNVDGKVKGVQIKRWDSGRQTRAKSSGIRDRLGGMSLFKRVMTEGRQGGGIPRLFRQKADKGGCTSSPLQMRDGRRAAGVETVNKGEEGDLPPAGGCEQGEQERVPLRNGHEQGMEGDPLLRA